MQAEGVADTGFDSGHIHLKGLAGPAEEQQDKSEMNDVSAIPPRVSQREVHHGFKEILTGSFAPGARSFVELTNDRDADECGHHQGDPGVKLTASYRPRAQSRPHQ